MTCPLYRPHLFTDSIQILLPSVKSSPRYMSKRPLLSIVIPGPNETCTDLGNTEISCFSPDSPEPEVLIDSTSDEESEPDEDEEAEEEEEDVEQDWIKSPTLEHKRTSCCLLVTSPDQKQIMNRISTDTPQKTNECWRTRSTTC
ncbi:hypothetical protein CROQUDRAFT_337837 [Cronartium quercuum f. sp. fusiforme G11]|uniref:Uncharacterized protein n=1 Tax=Cronartium quercuum f. sp. fusiforme G11 TaxID=708437 RepID=A0A9P6T6R2_9BASI|nr:hypothetical protein CROQUDRAFT_337837 [Cronartium quercuum f. sp. fusiforme G11]